MFRPIRFAFVGDASACEIAINHMVAKYGGSYISFADVPLIALQKLETECGLSHRVDMHFLKSLTEWGEIRETGLWKKLRYAKMTDMLNVFSASTTPLYVNELKSSDDVDYLHRHGFIIIDVTIGGGKWFGETDVHINYSATKTLYDELGDLYRKYDVPTEYKEMVEVYREWAKNKCDKCGKGGAVYKKTANDFMEGTITLSVCKNCR